MAVGLQLDSRHVMRGNAGIGKRADYILSNNNRYYAVLESDYGVVPAIAASHRVPGVRLTNLFALYARSRQHVLSLSCFRHFVSFGAACPVPPGGLSRSFGTA